MSNLNNTNELSVPLPLPRANSHGWTRFTASGLRRLLENGDLREATADAKFVLENEDGLPEIIPVHLILLAISSDVFMHMFYGPMAETIMPIEITDITAETFKAMLEYIYANSMETVSPANAMELLHVAHKYDMDNLFLRCQNVAAHSLSEENVFDRLASGRVYDAEKLVTACYEFIDKHTTKVFNSEAFLEQPATVIRDILKRDTLAGDAMPEKCLCKALAKWARADSDRLRATNDLVAWIRFPIMTTNDVVEAVKSGILSKDEAPQVLSQLCGLPEVVTRFPTEGQVVLRRSLAEIRRKSEVTAEMDCPSCDGHGRRPRHTTYVRGNKRTVSALYTVCTNCNGDGSVRETTKMVVQPEIKCDFCGGFHGLG